LLLALHWALAVLGLDLDRRLRAGRCRPAELQPELLLACMVGGDAPVDLLGVVALALDDVRPGLETGLNRLDLGFAVLQPTACAVKLAAAFEA
jgi:hypothetical protein